MNMVMGNIIITDMIQKKMMDIDTSLDMGHMANNLRSSPDKAVLKAPSISKSKSILTNIQKFRPMEITPILGIKNTPTVKK